MLEIAYWKELEYDVELCCKPIVELFKTTSKSGFVPRVGDYVRHNEESRPAIKFLYSPERVNAHGDCFPERAICILGDKVAL